MEHDPQHKMVVINSMGEEELRPYEIITDWIGGIAIQRRKPELYDGEICCMTVGGACFILQTGTGGEVGSKPMAGGMLKNQSNQASRPHPLSFGEFFPVYGFGLGRPR